MKNLFIRLAVYSCLPLVFISCRTKPGSDITPRYPDWAKNAVIYEVNVRQCTPEGTFKAFETHLPRLKEMGVDILWFMPVYPIGEKNRKIPEGDTASLGSYYSVKDYTGINPEFGTMADFKSLVTKAQEMGFKVILDWVANHSAWDNVWVTEHPGWYKKDSLGNIIAPFDWTDVAKFDYSNKDLRKAMIGSMKYWVDSVNVDGFRCDVAGEVPVDFWNEARAELQKTKPLFMLAEEEGNKGYCDTAFDANYGWGMHHVLHNVAQGKDSVSQIVRQVLKVDSVLPKDAFQMNFITNHDENSWNGTAKEKFGAGENAFAVLTYTLPGMPLIYNGQEAGLNHRLRFFQKDTIDWTSKPFEAFYTKLNELKHTNEAIWNAPYGGSFELLPNTKPSKVLSFIREKGKKRVVTIVNLSAGEVTVNLKSNRADGEYINVFSKQEFKLSSGELDLALPAWGYWVLESE